jgi:hypothetical protein
MYISNLMMSKRGVAHSSKSEKLAKVLVHPGKVIASLDQYQREIVGMRRAFENENTLEISYEEFFEENQKSADKILSFLQVDRRSVEAPALKKIGSATIKDMVENYSDLQKALSGTIHERFIQ